VCLSSATEHNDLSSVRPDLVDSLMQRMHEVQQTVFDPARGDNEAAMACEAVAKNRGFWGPWR
jgi:hypothetical protein